MWHREKKRKHEYLINYLMTFEHCNWIYNGQNSIQFAGNLIINANALGHTDTDIRM